MHSVAYLLRLSMLGRLGAILLICCSLSGNAFANAVDDLIFAAKFDDARKVQTLLAQGVDPNAAEEDRGESVLMIAVREGSQRVIDALLLHPKIQLEAKALNGDTALMLASYLGDLQSVTKLLGAGARVNQAGWCALHYAATAGQLDIVKLLLSRQADINALSPNKTTPLMMAVRGGQNKIVSLLIERGADIFIKNEVGMNAYDFAVYYEQSTLANLLAQQMSVSKP